MPSDTFWGNPTGSNPSGGSVLSVRTVGDQQDGPIDVKTNGKLNHLPGTLAGAVPSAYTASAQAVYPWVTVDDATYTDFATNKLAEFSSWHSAIQARYLGEGTPPRGFYSIPAVDRANPATRPDAAYILGSDGRTVINVVALTVSDYQRLSSADKIKLEAEGVWTKFVAPTLGLETKTSTAGINLTNTITSLKNSVSSSSLSAANKTVFLDQIALIERRIAISERISASKIEEEIGRIAERFKRVSAFSSVTPEQSMVYVEFVGTEDKNNYRYVQFTTPGPAAYAISSDGGATVNSGLSSLMRAEREMLTAQLRREALSQNNAIYDPKSDVANLIYQLQLLYQSEATAVSDAGTEEIAQLHRLLSDYAIIQRLVNETLKHYNPKETDEKRRFLNLGATTNGNVQRDQESDDLNIKIVYSWSAGLRFEETPPGKDTYNAGPGFHWTRLKGNSLGELAQGLGPQDVFKRDDDGNLVYVGKAFNVYREEDNAVTVQTGGLSDNEMRIVGMFASDPWGSGLASQDHPIEALYDVERPKTLLGDTSEDGRGSLRLERRDYWDKWSTQLADAVTILNQKNQLKQSEIENATKEANRHFDLGNNALRKMNEMLMSIGRM